MQCVQNLLGQPVPELLCVQSFLVTASGGDLSATVVVVPVLGLDQGSFQFGAVVGLSASPIAQCMRLRFIPGRGPPPVHLQLHVPPFPNMVVNVPQSRGWEPPIPHLPQYKMSLDFGSISVFMNNEVKHLFWFGVSSFVKCLFRISPHVIIEATVLCSLIYRSCS